MKVEQLVSAIQQGALEACSSVQQHNLKLIDLYFKEVEEEENHDSLKSKLLSSFSSLDIKHPEKLVDEFLSKASDDFLEAFDKKKGTLIPKTVTIQYPRDTKAGSVPHEVIVPLITIVPLNLSEVTNVSFKTKLEVKLVDDELNVSFPGKTKKNDEDTHLAELEVSIDKIPPPEGLQKLIEGYERSLRAQIPG